MGPGSRELRSLGRGDSGAGGGLSYYVYMLTSGRRGTLYVGVTNDLVRRIYQHQNKLVPGFTKKHNVHRLVWFEIHDDIDEAILKEKRMKRWLRAWKVDLIEQQNKDWHDLWPSIAPG